MDLEKIKTGIVSYLKVARGEKALNAGSAEWEPVPTGNEGGWNAGGDWWGEPAEADLYAGEMDALNKGKGKGQFQGNCNNCGKWGA